MEKSESVVSRIQNTISHFSSPISKMFDISLILVAVSLILAVVLAKLLNRKWVNAPPGPNGLPLIGSLHKLARKGRPLDVFQEWKETYGDVVGFHLGNYRCVLLSGYDNIKEAFNMWEFSGRKLLKPFHEISGGEKNGLILSEGQTWTEQRRFALRHLRDFGFGKKSMESLLQEDITDLIGSFTEFKGKPFIPHRKFSTAILRSLWEIIAGERFKYGDPKFQAVLDGLHSITSSTSITGPYVFLPWLADLFPEKTGWATFKENVNRAKNLVKTYIENHQKSFQSDTVRDFIDIHMKEQKESKDSNSSFHAEEGEKNLLIGVLNLFGAGSETTSNTLVWALLYHIKNPEVQKKLYKEIIEVVGNSRMPSLEDRESCIYTWATMEEILRMSSLAPFGVMHCTMSDVTFKGYFIPKDTIIIANLFGHHYDTTVWKDPDNFRPERFLDITEDGKYKKKTDVAPVIAFSIGKRVCLGEVLARNNFFLYLTSLIQRFEFSSEEDLETEGNLGLVRTPKQFNVIARERTTT